MEPVIDCDFPGGNITIRGMVGGNIYLTPDLRDTDRNWFYWYFRVRRAEGRTLRFQFDRNVIGTRGPAVSRDQGRTWQWLGREIVHGQSFCYTFAGDETETRFCFTFPYVEEHLHAFLAGRERNPRLRVRKLARTRKNRDVEAVYVLPDGHSPGAPPLRVLLTCRHHACESVADYVLEGMLEAMLSGDEADWFAEHIECLAIPFVDKDGVEDGDQGKNRRPHDHDHDYAGESLYPAVQAIRAAVPGWSESRLRVVFDLHCPTIRGRYNESFYLVGSPNPGMWREQEAFGRILESVRKGPLPYWAQENLPFGEGWNTPNYLKPGKTFASWAEEIPGVQLVSLMEIPYATVSGATISAAAARALGGDLCRALRVYLSGTTHEGLWERGKGTSQAVAMRSGFDKRKGGTGND